MAKADAEGEVVMRGTREQVFAVLAEYASYADWMPGVTSAAVLHREESTGIVWAEFLSPALRPDKYVLEFVESPPGAIAFHEVGTYRARGLAGEWALEPAGDGEVRVRGALRWRTSPWRRLADRRVAGALLHGQLAAVQEAVALARGESGAAGPGQVVLDVIERDGTIEVTFRGQRYELRRAAG